MKRKFMVLISVLMLVFIAAGGGAEDGALTADRKITFDAESYTVYVGRQQKITAVVESVLDTAPKQTQLVWTSSDESVAAVNAGGIVNGKKAGKVTVTVTAKDNEFVTASISVEVRVPVQSVKINENNVSVLVGGSQEAASTQLTVMVNPVDAYYQSGTWTSSNESVATVDGNGVVTGISAGNAVITFTSDDPNGTKTNQTTVKVNQAITGINSPDEEVVHVKKSLTLKPEVLPDNATNKKLEFSSSDPSIASVTPAGQVTGVANGEATITCKATDGSGITSEIHIQVFQPVQSLKLDKTQLNAFAGKTTEPLTVKIIPEDAKYQDYTWTSSDESIAKVNEKGEITGVAGGKVQITATSKEPVTGNAQPKSATCQVTVTQAVECIRLEKNEKKTTNKKLVLTLTVLPETASNKKVEWKSSNKKVATVENGVVTIKKREGSATITATAKDGSGIYASCDVSVGFSGMVLQVGSYVRREGVYSWDVSNFTGNGFESGSNKLMDLGFGQGAVIKPRELGVFEGHTYQIFRDKCTWSEAKEKCEKAGGHLVTITSPEEQKYIDLLNSENLVLWIGLYRDSMGTWKWVDGKNLGYTNWDNGEPNNYNSYEYPFENAGAVRPAWNDYHEDNTADISGYICEWDDITVEVEPAG